jgi:hypothetical protein
VPRRQKPPMTTLELGARAAGLVAYRERATNEASFWRDPRPLGNLSKDALELLECMDPALFWKWFLIGWATAIEEDISK